MKKEIDSLLKNHRLGQWNVGLQKGFREYDQDTYDLERQKLEEQIIKDMKANKDPLVSNMNQEIYDMEAEILQMEVDRIEEEELGLEHLGEDDDFGELDGDEFY